VHREPPDWYGQPYSGYERWDDALWECRELLIDWAKHGYLGTYSEIVERIHSIPWPQGPFTHNGAQIGRLLGDVSVQEWLENRPLLSALVVRADERSPGRGFFELASELGLLSSTSEEAKLRFWSSEVAACYETWSRREGKAETPGRAGTRVTPTAARGQETDAGGSERRDRGAGQVVGVDGYRDGWVAVELQDGRFSSASIHAEFASLLETYPSATVIAVDIPIGLPESGLREADVAAKKLLGSRASSVFLSAPRAVLECATHREASELSRRLRGTGISQQAFGLRHRIFEVEKHLGDRVIEVHPEVSFHALARGNVPHRKKSWNGFWRRWELLRAAGIELPSDLGLAGAAPLDDVADAAAAAWSAHRYEKGEARPLPEEPPIDPSSRLVAIWY